MLVGIGLALGLIPVVGSMLLYTIAQTKTGIVADQRQFYGPYAVVFYLILMVYAVVAIPAASISTLTGHDWHLLLCAPSAILSLVLWRRLSRSEVIRAWYAQLEATNEIVGAEPEVSTSSQPPESPPQPSERSTPPSEAQQSPQPPQTPSPPSTQVSGIRDDAQRLMEELRRR